jgi:hypothetical protein
MVLGSRIQGSKKHRIPDPGTGSATLRGTIETRVPNLLPWLSRRQKISIFSEFIGSGTHFVHRTKVGRTGTQEKMNKKLLVFSIVKAAKEKVRSKSESIQLTTDPGGPKAILQTQIRDMIETPLLQYRTIYCKLSF